MRDICEEYATNWNQMLRNRQVTIVTIHNNGKSYEVGGNVSFQHVGGDWWRKCRVVELYKNFCAKSSFIHVKRVPVIRGRARGGGSCHEVTIVNFRFHESRNKKFTFHHSRTCARNCNQNLYKKVHSLTLPIIYSCWKGDIWNLNLLVLL